MIRFIFALLATASVSAQQNCSLSCPAGETCVTDSTGAALCRPTNGSMPCGNAVCQPGEMCDMTIAGAPVCVMHNGGMPCGNINCQPGEVCNMTTTGAPVCVMHNGGMPCGNINCQPGEICDMTTTGVPTCTKYPRGMPCGGVDCKPWEMCSNETGAPVCKSMNTTVTCGTMQCPPGEMCSMDSNGVPVCRATGGGMFCGNVNCQPGEICDMDVVTGAPVCVNHKGGMPCGNIPGEVCNMTTTGAPVCVMHNGGNCQPGEICNMTTAGAPVCVAHSGGMPCGNVNCQPGEICDLDVATGTFVCVMHNRGMPCGNSNCKPGEMCDMTSGAPVCVAHNGGMPCGNVNCQPGEICDLDVTTGTHVCVMHDGRMPCGYIFCQPEEVCDMDLSSGAPICVNHNRGIPCGNTECHPDEICVQEAGASVCKKHNTRVLCGTSECQEGEYCKRNDTGVVHCAKATCDDFPCFPGAMCVLTSEGPSCHPLTNAGGNCGDETCLDNEICEPEVSTGGLKCVIRGANSNPCVVCGSNEICEFDRVGAVTCQPDGAVGIASCDCQGGTGVCAGARCIDQSALCGNTICTPTEKCEYRKQSGGFTCIAPCGRATNFCKSGESCIYNSLGEEYCTSTGASSSQQPCGLTYCNTLKGEVCVDGSCFASDATNPAAGASQRINKRGLVRGTFGLGDCSLFNSNLQTKLIGLIRKVIGDEAATVAFECGSIHFVANTNTDQSSSLSEIQTNLNQEVASDAELSTALGPESAYRLETLPQDTATQCTVTNGAGILSGGLCFVISCDSGYSIQSRTDGQVGHQCVPSGDDDGNDDLLLLIIIVSVVGCLFLTLLVALFLFYRKIQSDKAATKNHPQYTKEVPVVGVVDANPIENAFPMEPAQGKVAAPFDSNDHLVQKNVESV
eukprot:TRINITY_DN2502_c0_g1_i8.p1 TRINITY_DN2502_c0_g1~~TRINITY_DN2502_c0_g1_i8.p1  ORF type:complete len:919 (+),score=160.73 TRINITY_DN2502_c0_g1_i8:48-2759(+)